MYTHIYIGMNYICGYIYMYIYIYSSIASKYYQTSDGVTSITESSDQHVRQSSIRYRHH